MRLTGDWETWVLFFAEGIREMADGAVTTARKLEEVSVEDRGRIQSVLEQAEVLSELWAAALATLLGSRDHAA